MILSKPYRFFQPSILVCVTLLLTLLSVNRASNANENRQAARIDTTTESHMVKIGVLAKRGAARCQEKWGPTADYLTANIPE